MSRSVAYFSMEIGIKPMIKTYSGGLGVLAGDTLKSAADQGLDFTGVTLLYRGGYFRQELRDGYQHEEYDDWNYEELLEDTGQVIEVEIKGETVKAKIWKYSYDGEKSSVDIYFLDTGLEENSDKSRDFTHQLYDIGNEKRLCQETLLGIGGYKALKALDLVPDYYHMNEGHSALLTLEAEKECVFTTHTPVAAGHDTFSRELAEKVLGERAEELDLENGLHMTELALKNSGFQNAVSEKHRNVSEKMFPEYKCDAVTNGVHSKSWTSENIQELFDEYCEYWRKDAQRLTQASKIPDSELWDAKKECKSELAKLVEDKTGKNLDAEKLTIGFARRSTSYKRPTLIFKDIKSLEKLGEKYSGLQIVFGGKAHPEDEHGKELIQNVLKYQDMLENVDVFFVEDYGMEEALKMVSGCDLWLNNPVRGQEASGTSGMKAAHNGTPQLSVLDGWWLEGHIEDVTGWSIGEDYVEGENEDEIDAKSIYRKLDHIISIYENERQEWLNIMKNTISLSASYFNTDRMVKEYVTKAYK
mgnify:CR=1 FL=1